MIKVVEIGDDYGNR